MSVTPVKISASTLTTCLGRGNAATITALQNNISALQVCNFETVKLDSYIGEVAGVDEIVLPEKLFKFDCRNNRLAFLALQQDGFAEKVNIVVAKYGAHRVGVFLGTSTSGILQTELAFRRRNQTDDSLDSLPADFYYRQTHNTFSVGDFIRDYFVLKGMAMVISTACSSSAKVFAAATRQLNLGTIDAAIVGGVDSLCLTTLYGFSSLQLVSSEPCRPFDEHRQGICIGEGAGLALLENSNPTDEFNTSEILLLGVGETSDAYHMSSPHPEGLGAEMAMRSALKSAALISSDIDYINMHGTATPANDSAEGKSVAKVFGNSAPCSSTKGATGHTLGAAGAVEALMCALGLKHGLILGSPGTQNLDPAIEINYQFTPKSKKIKYAMTNSFGFGGSNCSLIFGVRG